MIEGSKRAYTAVMNPREGTILSVIRETAEAAISKTKNGESWREVVEHCYEVAQQSTLNTPNLLDELKKAGVVDAGALGFVYLIQGWLFVIANTVQGPKIIDIRSDLENLHNNLDINHSLDNLQYRFCTEGLLTNSSHDKDEIEYELKSFGDSFLLISDSNSYKMHIHTNSPTRVFKIFSQYGNLQSVKIDDMKAQTISAHKKI